MSNSIGQISLDLCINMRGFQSQLLGIQKQGAGLAGVFGSLGKIVAGAFAVRAVVNFGKECLQLGSDLQEVQNVVDVTFGSMSGKVDEFAKSAMTSYGLSEKVAKEYMGQFGAMSKAFGNTTEAAYDQSEALTALTGDVASFYNLSTDEAFTKLKAVYTGETEALKSLGVVMTQTALDEFAMAKGMGKTTKQMSEQEKVSLRLAFVTDRLKGASDDFSRTAGGWANQTKVLKLRFDQLKATLGQGFINILTPTLGVINELLEKLQAVADVFVAWTEVVFGDAGGSSSLGGATDASGSIADNMGSAVESAKKYVKTLAGFDKLNLIGSSSNSGGGGTGSGSSGGGDNSGDVPSGATGGSGPDISTELKDKIASIVIISSELMLAIGMILTFTGANIPLGIGLIAAGAGILGPAFEPLWDSMSKETQNVIGAITLVSSSLMLAIGMVLAFSGSNIGLGIGLIAAGAIILGKTKEPIWSTMSKQTKDVVGAITTTGGALMLAIGMVLAFSGVKIPLGLGLIASGAVILGKVANPMWDSMSQQTKDVVGAITYSTGSLLLAIGMILAFSGVKIPLGLGLMASGAVILGTAKDPMWNSMTKETQAVITDITTKSGALMLAIGMILAFTGANVPLGVGLIAAGAGSLGVASWSGGWDGIKNSLLGMVYDVANIVIFVVDCIIWFVNGVIALINGAIGFTGWKIPEIPGVRMLDEYGKHSVPMDVSWLASGGYVAANTPQLAVIGDNKHEGEIVAPESKIAEAVATGFASVLSKMQQGGGAQGGSQTPVIIKIGESDVWRGFIDFHNSEVARTGESPLLV